MSDEPVDATTTLYEEVPREIWQCELVSSDGIALGRAVSQIVERRLWTVRYLVVYDPVRSLRLLLPATLIIGVEPGKILCSIAATEAALLPEYRGRLSRVEEVALYKALDRMPYWEEESGFLSPMTSSPLNARLPLDPIEPV